MKCPRCKGSGSPGLYDGVKVDCFQCDGAGRIRRRDWWSSNISYRWADVREWAAFTRLGSWWWEAYWMERRARRLAKDETFLQLSARCGHSANRLQKFAKHLEDGHPCERHLDKERRLHALYNLACKMRAGADKWDHPENIEAGMREKE